MKINNIGYLLKEGIKGIFKHGFMSFAAVCVTLACLLIIGSFSILVYNVNIMVDDLNKTNEILVYIDSELPDAEAKSVGTKINQISNVLQAEFVSREEALEAFIADHKEEGEAFAGVVAGDVDHRPDYCHRQPRRRPYLCPDPERTERKGIQILQIPVYVPQCGQDAG